MLTLLLGGHVRACPAFATQKIAHCDKNCEGKRYSITGILAYIVGFAEISMGYVKSLSLLSDGVHGLTDGSGDFVSAWVARTARKDVSRETIIRQRGNRIVALLLGASIIWILYELLQRIAGVHTVSPHTMVLFAAFALITHSIRFVIIHKSPFKNKTQKGLLWHLLGDTLISISVLITGIVALSASLTGQEMRLFDLALSTILLCFLLYIALKIWRGKFHTD